MTNSYPVSTIRKPLGSSLYVRLLLYVVAVGAEPMWVAEVPNEPAKPRSHRIIWRIEATLEEMGRRDATMRSVPRTTLWA